MRAFAFGLGCNTQLSSRGWQIVAVARTPRGGSDVVATVDEYARRPPRSSPRRRPPASRFAAYVALPESLDVRTDIVGFPTFANFNIDRYFWLYGLAVGFLPVATLGLYLALTRIFVGRLPPVRPLPAPSHRIEVDTGSGRVA